MNNYDITFCNNINCKNKECYRNQRNYIWNDVFMTKPYISIAEFKDCEYWEEENDKNKQ